MLLLALNEDSSLVLDGGCHSPGLYERDYSLDFSASVCLWLLNGQMQVEQSVSFPPFRRQYLIITRSQWALDLALPVVLHDHHGGIDFPHCQVCCCWENDKLPCKIRPFGMDPEREGWLKGVRHAHKTQKHTWTVTHTNIEQIVFSQTDWFFFFLIFILYSS